MSSDRWILAAALMLPLAGCATVDPVTGSTDRHFGEAVAWNKEVQVINPDPVYAATAAKPGSSGDVAAGAAKRYRTDTVKQVQEVQTSGVSSGSSGPR